VLIERVGAFSECVMREIEFTGATAEEVEAKGAAWIGEQRGIKLIGETIRSHGFGFLSDHDSWLLKLYFKAADDAEVQVHTTQLLDIWRATSGAYIERNADGDFFFTRRNGSIYLGPIPVEMIDDLE
jgi:hypothetical protein